MNTPAGSVSASNLKPPKPPDRPLVPYMRFSRKMWASVREENPDRQLWDIGKVIGQRWRELADVEKSQWQGEYEREKVEYESQMKIYHNSAAYQSYLANKNRAKLAERAAEQQRAARAAAAQMHSPVSRPAVRQSVERGVVIQPADEDDGEAQVSLRRAAAQRFGRNQQLVASLFSSAAVQDGRGVLTQDRIDQLKRQAHSLSTHQTKLEDELKRLEENFQAKKRHIEESSKDFAVRLQEVCKEEPQVDDAAFEQMVDDASQQILDAFQRFDAAQKARGQTEAAAAAASSVADERRESAELLESELATHTNGVCETTTSESDSDAAVSDV